ncbi:hypothetical protein C7271_19670, partial [filamentous cyanobacterium CCP5]
QLEMLLGEVQVVDGQLRWSGGAVDLLSGVDGDRHSEIASLLAGIGSEVDLSHPYYWSAFALVGSPW